MNGKHTVRNVTVLVVALVLGTVLAASAAAGRGAADAARLARDQALNARYGTAATRMSPAAFRALYLRGVALNQRYRLGDYAQPGSTRTATAPSARDQALNELYGNAATRMSPAEFRALYVRAAALNQRYGLGDYARPTAPPAVTAPAVGGFDWVDAAIGAAALLGVLLLAAAAAFSLRGRWHQPMIHSH